MKVCRLSLALVLWLFVSSVYACHIPGHIPPQGCAPAGHDPLCFLPDPNTGVLSEPCVCWLPTATGCDLWRIGGSGLLPDLSIADATQLLALFLGLMVVAWGIRLVLRTFGR